MYSSKFIVLPTRVNSLPKYNTTLLSFQHKYLGNGPQFRVGLVHQVSWEDEDVAILSLVYKFSRLQINYWLIQLHGVNPILPPCKFNYHQLFNQHSTIIRFNWMELILFEHLVHLLRTMLHPTMVKQPGIMMVMVVETMMRLWLMMDDLALWRISLSVSSSDRFFHPVGKSDPGRWPCWWSWWWWWWWSWW